MRALLWFQLKEVLSLVHSRACGHLVVRVANENLRHGLGLERWP